MDGHARPTCYDLGKEVLINIEDLVAHSVMTAGVTRDRVFSRATSTYELVCGAGNRCFGCLRRDWSKT